MSQIIETMVFYLSELFVTVILYLLYMRLVHQTWPKKYRVLTLLVLQSLMLILVWTGMINMSVYGSNLYSLIFNAFWLLLAFTAVMEVMDHRQGRIAYVLLPTTLVFLLMIPFLQLLEFS